MSDFEAKITAKLDTTEVEQKLKELDNKTVKFSADTGTTEKNISNINKNIITVQKNTTSFGNTLKSALNIGSAAAVAAKSIRLITQAANEAVEAVKDIDAALTQVQIVTGVSDEVLKKYASDASEAAKEVGASITAIIESTETFARLGYSLTESLDLSSLVNKYANVADITVNDATDSLVAIMKAFNIAPAEMEGVVDELVKVGQEYAISASELGQALQNGGAALAAGGNTLEEAIALLASGNAAVQNASTAGNALKTTSMRIRSSTTELEELGEEVDDLVKSASDYQAEIKALSGVDIMLDENTYKSTYQILKEIAEVWDDLTDIQQATLLEDLAGKRNASVIKSVINNLQDLEGAYYAASNATGTLAEANETYMDSIEAKTKQLQAAFEALSTDTISSNLYAGIIDATTAIVEFLDKTNLLKGSLAGLAAAGAIKLFTGLATGISSAAIRMNEFNTALKMVKAGNLGEKEIEQLGKMTANLSESQLKAVLSTKTLTTQQRIEILMAQGMSEADAQAAVATMGLATAEGVATTTTFSLSGALKGLWATLLANPLVLVVAAITAVVSVISSYNQAVEEARQNAKDAAEAAASTSSELSALIIEYNELSEAVKTDDSVTEDFIDTQDELIEKLGLTKSQIEDLVNEYGNLSDAIKNASIDELQKLERDIRGGLNAYEEELLKAGKSDWGSDAKSISGSKTNGLFSTSAETRSEQKRAYQALAALEKAGLISHGSYSTYTDSDGSKYSQGFATYIGLTEDEDLTTVEGVINAYNRLGEMLDIVADAAGSDNFVYEKLYDTYNSLSEAVTNYQDAIGSLNENLAEQYVLQALVGKEIPKTQDEFDDYRKDVIAAAKSSGEFIGSQEDIEDAIDGVLSSQSQFADFYNDYSDTLIDAETATAGAFDSIVERVSELTETYDTLKSSISAVQDALASQSTGESLSVEDFNSEELADYTSALEYHNGVLQLNAEKVAEIVEAKTEEAIATNNANKAMAQSKYLDNAAQIEKLRQKIIDKNYAEGESEETIQANIDALLSENSTLKTTCDTYDLMSASLQEATDAYHNWLNAQNAAEAGDMFDDTLDAINHIIDTLNDTESDLFGRIGREDYKAAVDLIIPNSVDQEDTDAVNSYLKSVYDLFTYDEDGNYAGLNIENFCQRAIDAGLMVLDEASDSYVIAGQKTMEDFADGLGLSLPLVQAVFGEMEEFGGEFSWADEANKTIGDLAVSANVAAENLRALNQDMLITLDVSDLDTTAEKTAALDETIRQMQEHKGKVGIDASEIEYANSIISYCVTQKQALENPAILDIDTTKVSEISESAASAVSLLQEFKTEYNNLQLQQSLGLDTTEAEQAVDSLREQIASSDNDYIVNLSLDSSTADSLNADIAALTVDDVEVAFSIDDTALLSYEAENKQATVIYDIDTSAVDAYNPKNLSRTVTYYVQTQGSVSANGTAHAGGTAMAGGNWGTATGGKTLTGELGREIVVDPRTGRWYTVGDYGAEFVNIPKGAIVFNHKQTESLLENGYVAGRASALVGGTAMVTGGISTKSASNSTKSGGNSTSNYGKSSSSSKSSTSSKSTSTTEDAEEELKVFDWIEILIDRVERAIDRLKTTATSAYKALKTKLGATYDEISKVNEELAIQEAAYNRYIQQANSVGLSSDLAEKVRNGAIDISEYDEDTQELIESYQEFYEKALDCSDAIQQLHEDLASLYEDNFNNIQSDYNNQLALLEHLTNTYNTGIDALEERGYLASTKYYSALQNVEKQNISVLNKELADLEASFSEAMASGEIEKFSQSWYDMQTAINSVKEEIDEANLSLLEYAKTMREIEWSYFDYVENRISQITSEADFLIDLMSNSNLYTDKGQLTDEGMATMGLHAQNYNVYMAQADQYADEILALDKEIANDPYNTDLIERREELLELQQESILAAEDEKQAIVDLVEEGINIELQALQDLIDAYTDSLDSAKDLYEYQKKIEQKTADIATLQKQLAAYENDTSEETRAKIQQIKVDLSEAEADLAETEYEQFISDAKKLLDNLYDEYEMILNERLDNVDLLLSDMIDSVNQSSADISDTLQRVSDEVGYTMTQSLQDIWSNDGGANSIITKYGDSFTSQLTSVNQVLSSIQANVAAMVSASDSEATSTTSSTSTTTTPTSSSSSKSTSDTSTGTSSTSTTFTDAIKKGVAAAIWIYGGSKSGWGNDPDRKKKLTAKFGSTNATAIQSYINAHGSNGDLYKYWVSTGKSNLSQYYYSAFKTGGLADYTGMAWLDGTPTKPELVLNAQDTENFLKLRDTLRDMAAQTKLSIVGQTQNASAYGIDTTPQVSCMSDISKMLAEFQNSPVSQSMEYSFGDMNITIDHVENYEDFVNKLRDDKKFEQFIQDISVNLLGGGSSLAKNRHKW